MTISDSDNRQLSRRAVMRGLGAVGATGASTGMSGCLYLMGTRQREARQQQRISANPISFASQRNRITPAQADLKVTTRSKLINAVGQPNTTIWIPGDATIDMTGESQIKIANNVTIASNRNLKGGKGGLIKTTDRQNYGVFITKSPKVHFRVTGVRLKGPRTDHFDPVAQGRSLHDYTVTGFRAYGRSIIVDNCEVFGWTNAAFIPGTKDTQTQGWFHHNSMHHNQMNRLGYPMDLYNGQHLIEWNYFDYNRHSIAGFGYPNNGYEARFNVVGPNAIQHAFDMHYLGENRDDLGRSKQGMVAGKYVNVHHNVFELTSNSAFSIQGIPKQHARFAYNWCAEPKEGASSGDPEGVVFYPDGAAVRVNKNVYGQNKAALQKGRKWLKDLQKQLIKDPEIFPTQPSPTGLSISLSLTAPPILSRTGNTTTTPNSTSNNTMETSSLASQSKRANPLTGTELTPVGGSH
ncbi:hypothetical protein [Halocatena marina]|uniref:hypothetical protein n=1 Tax=Halocatena marina TaxID=2934937 RepID=UPI00200C50DB|nr:hypothetical protein [Halocatena marina]